MNAPATPLPSAAARSNAEVVHRAAEVALAATLLLLVAVPLLLLWLAVWATSAGPGLFWSRRIGTDGRIFDMPKLRTMRLGTPEVPPALLPDARAAVTPLGRVLRRAGIDELPQLWSVLRGDMSLVGPRPALVGENELIAARAARGLSGLRPGITGWAQVNGRTAIPMTRKVELDECYARRRTVLLDAAILLRTPVALLRAEAAPAEPRCRFRMPAGKLRMH